MPTRCCGVAPRCCGEPAASESRPSFGKSRQHFGIPLVDLRLTTIEPVDIRGAIYADDALAKTVWFPPEFLPSPDVHDGILFLDELTAADQRLQISAYSLILDRRVGNYRLPDGWQVIAAGNASFHGAVSHDMGTALADRMFHFNVQTVIDAFLDHATAMNFAPEVMAYLKIRPDKLDDTQAQIAGDYLIGASPRGWEDISNVLKSGLSDAAKRVFVQGRIGAANAAEFFGVLREIQAGADVLRLLAARPGAETAALLPRSLDALYGMIYGLLAASIDEQDDGARTRNHRATARYQGCRSAAAPRGADPGDGAIDAARARRGPRGRDPGQRFLPSLCRAAVAGMASMRETCAHHDHRGARAIQRMVEFAPSTGGLALWVRHQDLGDDDAPAVMTDGNTVFYGAAFDRLGLLEQTGVVAHEVLHIALRHPQRALDLRRLLGDVDLRLFNICADAIVNSTLGHLSWLQLPPSSVFLDQLLAHALDLKQDVETALLEWDVERLYRSIDDRRIRDKRGVAARRPKRPDRRDKR